MSLSARDREVLELVKKSPKWMDTQATLKVRCGACNSLVLSAAPHITGGETILMARPAREASGHRRSEELAYAILSAAPAKRRSGVLTQGIHATCNCSQHFISYADIRRWLGDGVASVCL